MRSSRRVHCNSTIVDMACEEAAKSDAAYRLGSVITKGRTKVMCKSHNTSLRTSYLNNVSNCMHAEMAVATKFINTHVRRNQIKVSNASF